MLFVPGGAQVGDDKVLGLDVTVIDGLAMTEGNGFAHLGKHVGDEVEAAVGK